MSAAVNSVSGCDSMSEASEIGFVDMASRERIEFAEADAIEGFNGRGKRTNEGLPDKPLIARITFEVSRS